jgi:hypothetical protein
MHNLAVHANRRRQTDHQKKITASSLDERLQPVCQLGMIFHDD